MFYKAGYLKNFTKFARKHLCWSHLLTKLHNKKDIPAQVFYCDFYKTSKVTFFTEHLRTTASGSASSNTAVIK